MSNFKQDDDGSWVPAIPMPLVGLRRKCGCGRKFWTHEGYREHYLRLHILLGGTDD